MVLSDADISDGTEAFEEEFTVIPQGDIGTIKIPIEEGVAAIEFKQQAIAGKGKADVK